MIFEGKAILITGASTGIGKDAALTLARLGSRVFAGVRKDADAAALRAEDTTKNITPVLLDVTKQDQIDEAILSIKKTLGDQGLFGLINNAGIAVVGPLGFLPLQSIRTQLDVNLIGQIAVTQASLSLLISGKGRIINIGSVSGLNSYPFMGAYAISKFALEAMSDALRLELRPWGIPVTILEPGVVRTPIWEKSSGSATNLIGEYPDWVMKIYQPSFDRIAKMKNYSNTGGLPVAAISKLIVQVLNSKAPKARYMVATPKAKFNIRLLRALPTKIRDNLIAKNFDLP